MKENGANLRAMSFAHKIKNRLTYAKLRFTGDKIGGAVSVNTENAEDLAQTYQGVKVEPLIESAGVSSLAPKHLPEDDLESLRPFNVACETVLLDISNPDFSLRNYLLHDPRLNILFADTFSESEVLNRYSHAHKSVRHIKGTVAYLSNTWVDNYYHWLQLTLPLLRFYERIAPDVNIDCYYVGKSSLTSVQIETLERFNISPERIIREACSADRILMAIYLHRPQHGGMRFRDVWGQEFVRARYLTKRDDTFGRRIYVERGSAKTRRILNEPEVLEMLKKYGFVPVKLEGKTVAEQARLFANAEIIVGTHGAALTNLIFAHEGTKVLEIFPYGLQETSYFTAATHAKLDYYYLIGDGAAGRSSYNLRVNLGKLERLLQMAGVA